MNLVQYNKQQQLVKEIIPKDLFHNSFRVRMVFDNMNKSVPKFLNSVHVIQGDFASQNLGLNEDDEKLLIDKINIVFHCAANLNMQSKFKSAMDVNVKGTHYLMKLCEKMKNLKSAVVVSTVYSNCQHDFIGERIYKPIGKTSDILDLIDEFDDESLEYLKSALIMKSPNIYCFTKALAENVVAEVEQNLPIGIFRPSIVASTFKDPLPGWTDNVNGILGVMLAIMIGVMRVTFGKNHTKLDFVPADMCVNALICTAWDVHRKKNENGKCGRFIPVYNFCNKEARRITWKELQDIQIRNYKYAFKDALWAPFNILTTNKYLFNILYFLLHTTPAIVYDTCCIILGKQPKLMATYKKIDKTISVLVYFNLHEWKIERTSIDNLWDQLSEQDRQEFFFDTDIIDYDKYFEDMAYGIKKYYLKENMNNLTKDEKRLNTLKTVHRITKFVFIVICLLFSAYFIPKITDTFSQ